VLAISKTESIFAVQIKNNMTKLSKELADQMYNSGNEHFKAFALENYPELDKPKYAMKWEDLGDTIKGFISLSSGGVIYKEGANIPSSYDISPTLELAKAREILPLLLQLRNQWWEVDGWDVNKAKYVGDIRRDDKGELKTFGGFKYFTCPFIFKNKETAQLFLDTFKPMLEIAKPLL